MTPDADDSDLRVPPAPDGIGLILDVDTMRCVFEAQLLERIDGYMQDVIADAGPLGTAGAEVLERSVRLEIAAAMRITEYTAGELMRRADALIHRYPAVFDALSHAEIAPAHADALAKGLDEVEPALRDDLLEPALELARTLPVGAFRRKLRALIDTARVETLPERHTGALTRRRTFIEDDADGMSWLHLFAPSAEIHAIHDRATAIAKTLIDADRQHAGAPDAGAADADADDPGVRTLDQARADVLCDLLIDGAVAEHPKRARGIRATVVVSVPALSLLDDDAAKTAPATVEGLGPIPIDRARELCGGSRDWMRVLTHPETGIVLSVGRKKYKPPAPLRRLITWRSERCMTPGCGVPASRCDVDHQLDWTLGGETRATNLTPLCRGHHTVKGHGRWHVVQLNGGVIEWTSPTGRVYLVEPERRTPTFVETAPVDAAPF